MGRKKEKAGRHYFLVRFQNTSTTSLWYLLYTDCPDRRAGYPSSWIYTPSPLLFHTCSLQAVCLAKENASGRGKPLLIIVCESMSSLASLNRVSFLHYGKCSCNILMKVTSKYINNIDFDRREKGRKGRGREGDTQREWWRRLCAF